MENFHFIIVGSDTAKAIDLMEKQLGDLIKTLKKKGTKIESASINAGHFLGGSHNLVETEQTEVSGDSK